MYPLSTKGINEMNELDCMRAIVLKGGRAGLTTKGINEMNELDCLREMVLRSSGGLVPVNTLAPAIEGVSSLGNEVSCTTGNWTNDPTSYTYQWFLNDSPIPGETDSTWVVAGTAEDEFYCEVTAHNAAGASAPAQSNMDVIQYDPDAADYFAAIATAGGTITEGEKTAANNYILRLKSAANGTPWNQMVEIWEKICADPVAATVKLKHPVGSPAVITLNVLTGASFGLQALYGNGVDGYVSTGFIPDDHLSAGSQAFGVFTLGASTNVSGALSGVSFSFTDGHLGWVGGTAQFYSTSITGAQIVEGYHIMTQAGLNVDYWHPLGSAQAAGVAATASTNEIVLFKHSGAFFSSNGIGGYFAGAALTEQQSEAIIESREYLLGDVGLANRVGRFVAFGDSVANGSAASDAAHAFPALVAAGFSLTSVPKGNPSTSLAGTGATDGVKSVLTRVATQAPTRVAEAYGINDIGLDTGVPAFQAAKESVAVRLARITGIPIGQVISCTPNFVTSDVDGYQSRQAAYVAAAIAGIAAAGAKLANVNLAFGSGSGLLDGDGIHPNDAGMIVYANTILAA